MRRLSTASLWDRVGLPLLFVTLLTISLVRSSTPIWTIDTLWPAARSTLFFFMIWRTVRYLQAVIVQGDLAVKRLEDRDEARLSLLHSAEDYARAQLQIAEELRQFTARTTQAVTSDLTAIRVELKKNTALTAQAGEASAAVAEAVTHLHALADPARREDD